MGGITIGETLAEALPADEAFEYARKMVVAEINGGEGEVESTENGYEVYKNDHLVVSYEIIDDAEMEFDFLVGN